MTVCKIFKLNFDVLKDLLEYKSYLPDIILDIEVMNAIHSNSLTSFNHQI
jgi:hypothetical protein